VHVTRVEYRFHHTVIREFSRGVGEDINSYLEISNYLNDLFAYGLKTIRYQKNNVIAPLWQFLQEDIQFNRFDLHENFTRAQKPKSDTTAIARVIPLFVGTFISIRARSGLEWKYVQKELQNMPVMDEIRSHLFERKQHEGEFFEQLKQRYLLKKDKAAA